MVNESGKRSFLKALTWRVVATVTTTGIVWVVTGRMDAALTVGTTEAIAKLFIYYIHERIWLRIPFGLS